MKATIKYHLLKHQYYIKLSILQKKYIKNINQAYLV